MDFIQTNPAIAILIQLLQRGWGIRLFTSINDAVVIGIQRLKNQIGWRAMVEVLTVFRTADWTSRGAFFLGEGEGKGPAQGKADGGKHEFCIHCFVAVSGCEFTVHSNTITQATLRKREGSGTRPKIKIPAGKPGRNMLI